jgi:hypothetical protein
MQITFDPETLKDEAAAMIFGMALARIVKDAKANGKQMDAVQTAVVEAVSALWEPSDEKDV